MTQPPHQQGPYGQPGFGPPGHPPPGHQPGQPPAGPPQFGPPQQYGPPPQYGAPPPWPPQNGPQYPGPPPYGPPQGGPPPRKRPRWVLPVVIGVAVVLVAVLGTGLGWPGWMLTAGGGASVAADRSTPDSTARAVVDALNRRDVDQFVGQLVCADGRTMSDDGSTTLAEETLYGDIAALDPGADAEIANANPRFQLDEIRQIKPSDPSFSEDMADAQVAVVSVTYPDIPDALRAELPDLQGVLTLVNEDNAWVVCQMGFLPVGEVPGQVAPDPDPTSPTGRAQGFIGAVNAGDQGTARVFMCSTAYPVDEFAATAIGEGAQLRLNQRVEPMGANAQVQVWYTVNGQERRASGIMGQEQDGWCIQALALLAE